MTGMERKRDPGRFCGSCPFFSGCGVSLCGGRRPCFFPIEDGPEQLVRPVDGPFVVQRVASRVEGCHGEAVHDAVYGRRFDVLAASPVPVDAARPPHGLRIPGIPVARDRRLVQELLQAVFLIQAPSYPGTLSGSCRKSRSPLFPRRSRRDSGHRPYSIGSPVILRLHNIFD